jgi:hypothetical protein
MTYHLPRVMHWTQNRAIAHYPTHELRQLYQNPWAEFAIAHLQILGGNDRFANLVQWFSMVGSVLGVSFIAKQLGANLLGQFIAALVTATIPMGILQAVTTQNDYVISFWLICVVSFMLLTQQSFHWLYLLSTAGSIGLAILTKGTAYLFVAPFLIWFGHYLYKTYRWRSWQPILVIGVIAIIVNSGHYSRNLQLFGSPLKPDLGKYEYANEMLTLKTFVSNIVRNSALHINIPSPILVTEVEFGIEKIHHLLNVNVNEPRITFGATTFKIFPFNVNEDTSGNFMHLLLIFISLGVLIKQKLQQKQNYTFNYATLVTLAFLLFCLVLKWQPWHSRLHLPLFTLWAPVIGIVLSQLPYRQASIFIIILLVIQTIPFLLLNPRHPIIGPKNIFNTSRIEQYFITASAYQTPYQTTAQLITERNCDKVGLILPGDFWEYPFWVLLERPDESIEIKSLEVNNPSRILRNSPFEPCAIICVKCWEEIQKKYTEHFGSPILSYGPDILFIKGEASE